MKALRVITGFVLVAALFIVGVLPALAVEPIETSDETSAQLYPITNTDEWKNMSRADRVAACQIPEEEIIKMSTDDLLQHVLNYPFMIDIFAFSSFAMGFEHVYDEFSAISALIARKDYGKVLIDAYSTLPVETSSSAHTPEYSQNIRELCVLEILIAQPEMTDVLSSTEIADLAAAADEKFKEKTDACEIYSDSITVFAQALNEHPESAIAAAVSSPVKTPGGSNVEVDDKSGVADYTSETKQNIATFSKWAVILSAALVLILVCLGIFLIPRNSTDSQT